MLPQTHNYSLDVFCDAFGCEYLNGHNYCSLVHCDTSINPTWMRHITNSPAGFTTAGSICHPAPNKGCYVAGSHTSNAPNDDLIWVMKFDSVGNTIFSKGYGLPGYDINTNFTGMEITGKRRNGFPFYSFSNATQIISGSIDVDY